MCAQQTLGTGPNGSENGSGRFRQVVQQYTRPNSSANRNKNDFLPANVFLERQVVAGGDVSSESAFICNTVEQGRYSGCDVSDTRFGSVVDALVVD